MKTLKIALGIAAVVTTVGFRSAKEKLFIPPGTTQINDTVFADETEISNLSWKEFVEYNRIRYGSNSVEYNSSLPDTLVWRQKLNFNEPYVEYYFRHPAYSNYPVVGISWEQAMNFCKWRTERVHVMLEIKSGKRKAEDMNEPYKGKLKFEYRLPSKQEWEALAFVGIDPKTKEKQLKKSDHFFNFRDTISIVDQKHDNADVAAPVDAYAPNKLGLYNLFGNVSEMVSEKGICKGGSWRDKQENVSIWQDQTFEAANSWTGFRCVCVMKK